jgi:purine/pyrimidine-nucleoside phosphorylase
MNFKNVEVVTKANVYFDGKVTSRTILTADGAKKTLGVILPGTYHFGTQAPERMDITQGTCRVKIAGEGGWKEYKAGESFNVPGNSSFDIEAVALVDYVCHFL